MTKLWNGVSEEWALCGMGTVEQDLWGMESVEPSLCGGVLYGMETGGWGHCGMRSLWDGVYVELIGFLWDRDSGMGSQVSVEWASVEYVLYGMRSL